MGGGTMKQRYDSYKPSGIDWIGEIPSHWKLPRVKQFVKINNGSDPKTEGNIPVYGSGSGSFKTCGEYKIGPTVLLGRKGATLHIPHWIEGKYWNVDTAFDTKIIKGLHFRLFFYLSTLFDYNRYKSETTLPSMTQTDYGNMYIPLPPIGEQEAIAAWLDEKCGEIDNAIAKIDREIELIDELKQSEISRVVTRGLNPDVPLRSSGIDWIGDVPKHWTKSRIKHHICRSAAGVWGEDEKGNEDDVICFRIADFNYGERRLDFDKITLRNIDSKQLEGRLLSKGDLLIEKSGGGDATPVGRVVYCNYSSKATYTNFIHSITLKKDVDSRFFLFYFNMLYSNKINLLFFNQTTGLQNLQVGDYLAQSLYLPPLSEQQAIADYLDKKCAEIDGLKEKLVKKRETLKELRQAIISEVVTGKRKVI